MRRFFYDTEFIERPGLLELISIAIVGEDGSEFYRVSREFREDQASDWVRENVIAKLPPPEAVPRRAKAEIAADVLAFLNPSKGDPVELWGYYADYDHVLLCWLFGSMIDLPAGMPMLTLDLRQLLLANGNPRLPKGNNEHDALDDARWVRDGWRRLASTV